MTKGQRSNREIRKPKKDKSKAKVEAAAGTQIRNAEQPSETAIKNKPKR